MKRSMRLSDLTADKNEIIQKEEKLHKRIKLYHDDSCPSVDKKIHLSEKTNEAFEEMLRQFTHLTVPVYNTCNENSLSERSLKEDIFEKESSNANDILFSGSQEEKWFLHFSKDNANESKNNTSLIKTSTPIHNKKLNNECSRLTVVEWFTNFLDDNERQIVEKKIDQLLETPEKIRNVIL